jgi:hypothetical protein
MADLKHEVAQAVYSMYEALTVFGDAKNLSTPIGRAATDFNVTLLRAQMAFPSSDTLRDVEPLRPDDQVVTLLARLAVVKGGVDAQIVRRWRRPVRVTGPKIVRLPLPPQSTDTSRPLDEEPFEYDPPDLSGVSVLLAEQTVSLSELLRIGLAQCGAVVDVSESIPAALRQLGLHRPHIVLFDVRLAEGGVPLAAAAQGATLPAIALVARHVDANLETLLGAYRVRLLRTFDPVTIAAAIKNAVAEA